MALDHALIELLSEAHNLPPRKGAVNLALPDNLTRALITASECEAKIEPEVERLRDLQKEAKTDIEFNAREFQIEYVTKQLQRAAKLARLRQDHFASLTTKALIEEERHRIYESPAYWFQMYAWGYDPRARTPLAVVPFELHPRQTDLVEWLDETVFQKRTSGLIEKSRDEGATETIVRWGLYNFLFKSGFSMLLSTRKEDEVDSKKNQNTLFERIRYQIRLLPAWQIPKGFDIERDMRASMLLSNPQNGNTLLGEAPVENMGRGGRVTCAVLDEFAFWAFAGYPQARSLSQTTDSLIIPSSVAGRLNQYADFAHDGITRKFVMDWRDNPFKDQRWYDSLPYGIIGPPMSKTTIAQEVDRNYDAAQPGKVWSYKEPFLFITVDEFLNPFKKAGISKKFFDEGGRFRIPLDWRVTRTHDYGQSEGHDWGYLIGAQPPERDPLNDTHFIFLARNLEPTGLTTEQAVKQWREWEVELGLRNKAGNWVNKPQTSWNSHEQEELRRVLLSTYGESWLAWNTDYVTGIETIQDWMTVIDVEEPNPFREALSGRCKIVFVAPNGEYQLAYNERLAEHFVTISQTEAGFATLRKQISAYHYPQTELGKAVKAMRPEKKFDDIVDCLRGYSVNWNRRPTPLTDHEVYEHRLDSMLPPNLRRNADPMEVDTVHIPADADPMITRQLIEARLKKKLRQEGEFVPMTPFDREDDHDLLGIEGGW